MHDSPIIRPRLSNHHCLQGTSWHRGWQRKKKVKKQSGGGLSRAELAALPCAAGVGNGWTGVQLTAAFVHHLIAYVLEPEIGSWRVASREARCQQSCARADHPCNGNEGNEGNEGNRRRLLLGDRIKAMKTHHSMFV
jgi:hypothetical protein